MPDGGCSTCKGTVVGARVDGKGIGNKVGLARAEGELEGECVCVCMHVGERRLTRTGVCRNGSARDVSMVRNFGFILKPTRTV